MDVDFNQLSKAVMAYITAQGRSKETTKSYLRCLVNLGSYLNEKKVLLFTVVLISSLNTPALSGVKYCPKNNSENL